MNSTNNPTTTMKYTIFISVWLLLFGGCQKCKKDPAPDPCLNTKRVTADFMISETATADNDPYWLPNDTDTSGTYSTKFTALAEDCEYEWTLGRETIREKSFSRSGFPQGVPIEISLKVKRPQNKITSQYRECFPGDDAQDEKTRSFTQFGANLLPRIIGKYYGADIDKPNQLYTMETYPIFNRQFPQDLDGIKIKGIVRQDCDLYYDDISYGYNQILFFASYVNQPECLTPNILFNRMKNDSVKITYWVQAKEGNDFETRVKKIFKGKKIQ